MEPELNYKSIHLYLLSLFSILLLLSLTETIKIFTNKIIAMSITGIILSLLFWIIDKQILRKAEKEIDSYTDYYFQKLLDARVVASWWLFALLIVTFVIIILL